MIGIDLVEHSRIAKDLSRLANRILSEEELNYYNTLSLPTRKTEYVASRFALKEAIFKALGNNYNLSYKDFTSYHKKDGSLALKSPLNFRFAISISHSLNYSVAICYIIK